MHVGIRVSKCSTSTQLWQASEVSLQLPSQDCSALVLIPCLMLSACPIIDCVYPHRLGICIFQRSGIVLNQGRVRHIVTCAAGLIVKRPTAG